MDNGVKTTDMGKYIQLSQRPKQSKLTSCRLTFAATTVLRQVSKLAHSCPRSKWEHVSPLAFHTLKLPPEKVQRFSARRPHIARIEHDFVETRRSAPTSQVPPILARLPVPHPKKTRNNSDDPAALRHNRRQKEKTDDTLPLTRGLTCCVLPDTIVPAVVCCDISFPLPDCARELMSNTCH